MKIFKVSGSGYSYGDYASIIVVAKTKSDALKIAKRGNPYNWNTSNANDIYWEFKENQYPLMIEKINLNNEQVVLSEYIGE